MSDLDRWLTGNEAHLSASLSWLRLRFTKLIQQAEETGTGILGASAPSDSGKIPWWKFEIGKSSRDSAAPAFLKENADQLQARVSQASQAAVAAWDA